MRPAICDWTIATPVQNGRAVVTPNPKATPTISVIVPAYQSQRTLPWVLLGLRMQRYPAGATQVIVVADGDPGELGDALLREWPWDLRFLGQRRRGFRAGAARNLGVASASGEVLVFLDSDCVPQAGFLSAHARWQAPGQPGAAVFGPRHYVMAPDWPPRTAADLHRLAWDGSRVASPSNFGQLTDRRAGELRRFERHPAPFHLWHTCNASVRREDFAAVGGFDADFDGRWGYEDTELAYRLWSRRASTLVADPTALVLHIDRPGDDIDRIRDDVINFEIAHRKIPGFRAFKDQLRSVERRPWW
jgi:glycosyltransferase involved in cell wall biosynthesis